MNDLKFAFRQLLKNPGFTAVAMLTLALGIGANTAIFSLFNAVVLRPPDVKDADQLVRLYPTFAGPNERRFAGSRFGFSYPEYLDLQERNQSFAGVAAYADTGLTLREGEAESVRGCLVSGNYFSVLGAEAVLGRLLSLRDCETPGAHPVAVLSHAFWARRFGAETNLIGQTIRLNQQSFTVVGVAGPGFGGLEMIRSDVWIPLMMQGQVDPKRDFVLGRTTGWLQVVGRLKPRIFRRQAEAELAVLARQFDSEFPGRKTTIHVAAGSALRPGMRGRMVSLASLVMAAVGSVLLVACANVANLLLARAAGRQAEMSIRLALGAGRARLVRQLLTESVLLATLGGGAGILLGTWLARFLWVSLAPLNAMAPTLNVSPDWRVFAFCAVISFTAAVLFGLAPALQATKRDLASVLKGEVSAFGQRISQSRLRSSLVIGQLALSLVLLSGAGLFVKTLLSSYQVDAGFATRDVAVLWFDAETDRLPVPGAAEIQRQLQERLTGLPGVKHVALASWAPLSRGTVRTQIARDDAEAAAEDSSIEAHVNAVSPSYFETLGMQMLRGRPFSEQEARVGTPVAILNESAAERLWPGENPIGRRLREGNSANTIEVVGVVRNVRSVELSVPDGPFLYRPVDWSSPGNTRLFVRTDGNAVSAVPTLRGALRAFDPKLAVSIRSLDENVERWRSQWRPGALLSGTIGLLAALLAGAGLYGVMAYAVSLRTREIGIRMALGARAGDIQRLVLGQGTKMITIGLSAGFVMAVGLSRILSNRFFGLDPTDLVAITAVSALLAGIALAACYLPARRAARINPTEALRHE